MNKFLKESVLFTLFFVVIFVLINLIFIKIILTDWDFRKRLESLKFDNPDYELLVLGASFALDGIDTEFLTLNRIKSFNLSIGGSSFRTSYIQLDEYLTQCSKKPLYVIIGSNSYLDSYSSDKIHPIIEVTMKDYKYGLNDIPIIKFRWIGFEFFKKILSKKHRKAILSYGQLKFQKVVSDNTELKELYLDKKKIESSYWIGEIAQLCIQNGIELIIIEMPGFKETRNLSKEVTQTLCFTNGFTAPLYNFNSQDFCKIFDDNRDWIGNSHLNEFGAVKFTNELIKIIK